MSPHVSLYPSILLSHHHHFLSASTILFDAITTNLFTLTLLKKLQFAQTDGFLVFYNKQQMLPACMYCVVESVCDHRSFSQCSAAGEMCGCGLNNNPFIFLFTGRIKVQCDYCLNLDAHSDD